MCFNSDARFDPSATGSTANIDKIRKTMRESSRGDIQAIFREKLRQSINLSHQLTLISSGIRDSGPRANTKS